MEKKKTSPKQLLLTLLYTVEEQDSESNPVTGKLENQFATFAGTSQGFEYVAGCYYCLNVCGLIFQIAISSQK